MGWKVSGMVVNEPTVYIMLGLHGDCETKSSFLIPIISETSIQSFVVAVAVNAKILTLCESRLRISPIRKKTFRKVSPLQSNDL